MLRWAIAFAGLVSIAFAQAALAPPPARAAAACSLEFAVDSAGDWFNVIGYGYKSPPINLTFSAPVFVWSIDAPGTVVGAAVTTYVVPADSVDVPDGGVFKWTFKTEDPAAKTLDVTVADAHCESSRTADLDPYGHGTPQPTFPTPSLPSGDCTGHYVLYDRNAPGVPAVDTRWFNLFDSGFDNHALVTLTFDVPVIPWRMVHDPDVLPAVTTYTMPPNSKWAFRARDVGVTSITIKMSGGGCETTRVVNLDPNAPQTPWPTLPPTSTLSPSTTSEGGPPVVPAVLALAALGGVLIARRRLPVRR